MKNSMTSTELLGRLDWDLQTLFKMVERLCGEAHCSDADIDRYILTDGARQTLEIISDVADEVFVKATSLITEARLAIRLARDGAA